MWISMTTEQLRTPANWMQSNVTNIKSILCRRSYHLVLEEVIFNAVAANYIHGLPIWPLRQ